MILIQNQLITIISSLLILGMMFIFSNPKDLDKNTGEKEIKVRKFIKYLATALLFILIALIMIKN